MVSSLLFLGAEFTGVQQLACVILLWVGHVDFMYMCVMSNMYEVGGRILMDGVEDGWSQKIISQDFPSLH